MQGTEYLKTKPKDIYTFAGDSWFDTIIKGGCTQKNANKAWHANSPEQCNYSKHALMMQQSTNKTGLMLDHSKTSTEVLHLLCPFGYPVGANHVHNHITA